MAHIKNLNKKVALSGIWLFAAISWVILGAIFFITESTTTAIVAVTIAAVIGEAAIWLSGALLGLAIVDARKKLWRVISGRKLTA